MASTATEKRKFTYEDYLKTPNDERFELIGGELLMTPSPVPRHQRISGKIEIELRKYVVEKKAYYNTRDLMTKIIEKSDYPIEKLDGMEERLIGRYFKKTPEGYGISDEIKRHIVFDFHNLMHEGGYKDFDAVFCRNVLIYFDDETQKKVIDKFQRALVPQGYLVLGHAETLQGRNDNFVFIHKNKGTVYQKK